MFPIERALSTPLSFTKFVWFLVLLCATLFSVFANQQQQTQPQPSEQQAHEPQPADITAPNVNFLEAARKMLLEGDTDTIATAADEFVESVPYFQASIPMRIFECLRGYTVLRCTKLFVLQKMEENKGFHRSDNITKDFLNQFFGAEEQMGSLISGKLANITDKELNQRLVWHFQRFFKKRDIQLHFLPGIMVKIVPSRENKLKFSLKRENSSRSMVSGRSSVTRAQTADGLNIFDVDDDADEDNDDNDEDEAEAEATKKHGGSSGVGGGGGGGGGEGGKRKKMKKKERHSYKDTIIQMAVPVMIMPAILMGTFLPFVLPVLKMATFMSMLMNNSAFIAALIYAARTHINTQDESPQHISYGHQGYH